MRLTIVLAGTFSFAFVLVSSAHGQDVTSVEDASTTEPSQAYPGDSAPTGFRLVEHRIALRLSRTDVEAEEDNLGRHNPAINRRAAARKLTSTNLRRASYLDHVRAAEVRHALPAGLLDALVWTESRYNPVAVSRVGAVGLGQLMPGTARELGVTNRFDPVENINGAALYLRQMLNKFKTIHLALAAYNAGPGAVERSRGIPRNNETPAYVHNVLRRWRASRGTD